MILDVMMVGNNRERGRRKDIGEEMGGQEGLGDMMVTGTEMETKGGDEW